MHLWKMETGSRQSQRDPAPRPLQRLTEIADGSGDLVGIAQVALRAHHAVCHEIESSGKWPEFPTHEKGTGTHIAIGQTRLHFLEMRDPRF